MNRALSRVKARIRARRALAGLCWGAPGMLAAALGLLAVSFFRPLAWRDTALAALTALPPLAALAGFCLPVSQDVAARTADACGLRERVQTALALWDRTDEMALLQRADALKALDGLDVRRALPLRAPRAPLAAAAGCFALCILLLFLPNPQEAVLRAQRQFTQRMQSPAQAIAEAADRITEDALGEDAARELRRILGDLARETARSRDPREALTALSHAQQQMERLLGEARTAAAGALDEAGQDALAEALAAGDSEAIKEALAGAEADAAAEALGQAAASAEAAGSAAAAQALQNAADALRAGDAAAAAQALGQMTAGGLSGGEVGAAMQGARGAAGGGKTQGANGSGQGQGQGRDGQGTGAGRGSTNEEQTGGGTSASGGQAGRDPAAYRLGQYEQIYDPTRLGDGGEISQSTGRVDENGRITQAELGPGLGVADGSVPYDQVAGEYRRAAVQRAQEAALPSYAQEWIDAYFSALTEK